jgi:hypothetical protein
MSGTYTVSGIVLIFKVEASTYPNAEGTEQKRTIMHLSGAAGQRSSLLSEVLRPCGRDSEHLLVVAT